MASKPAEFEVLTQVDKFLRDGGTARRPVPHRERSIEVFGNEKRLDDLLRTRLFTSGALTLDLLRCFQAPLPLTAQHTGDPGARPRLLIVENHATYASALIVARERAAAGAPAVVVGYGSGKQLPASIAGVCQLDPVPTQLWYFGDLDEDGLVIARASATAARAAGLPPLRPALPLYRALVEHGTPQPAKAATPAQIAATMVGWLEDRALQDAVVDLLASGHRLAQEIVGLDRLAALPQWF